MISELLFNKKMIRAIEIYTDNKSLHDSTISKKNVLEKRLRIDIAMLRELFEQKRITKIHHINTKKQIANSLKKKVHQRKSYYVKYVREGSYFYMT